jgi:serine/threonine protein kinase
VHRDIKPDTLLLDTNLRPYLTDLAFARALGSIEHLSLVGTPYYMAPEIFTGQSYPNKVDVWSVGMVIYSFCTGPLPYEEFANGNEAEFRI